MLIAVNVYTERVEGEVLIWLAISQQDGKVFGFSFAPEDAEALHATLGDALVRARVLTAQDSPPPER